MKHVFDHHPDNMGTRVIFIHWLRFSNELEICWPQFSAKLLRTSNAGENLVDGVYSLAHVLVRIQTQNTPGAVECE